MRIAVVACSPLKCDSRLLRTATALSDAGHQVLLAGYAPAPDDIPFSCITVPAPIRNFATRAKIVLRHAPANLWPAGAASLYWTSAPRRALRQIVRDFEPDIVHANDWNTLPIALDAKARFNARIVYDAHEMASAEHEEKVLWRWLIRRHVLTLEAKGLLEADAVVTVSDGIAKALAAMKPHHKPVVIRNLPDADPETFRATGATIQLLFHGLLRRNRGLEELIASVPLWKPDRRLTIRGYGSPTYLKSLRAKATLQAVEHRIDFQPAVAPDAVIAEAAKADLGIVLLPDTSRQNRFALPNKLFEYIGAGLGIIASPLPDMAKIVTRYRCGRLSACDPRAIADTVNRLEAEEIDRLKRASLEAAKDLNWAHEKTKLLALYESLK